MNRFVIALAALSLVTPAAAQDQSAQGAVPAVDLPAICLKDVPAGSDDMSSMQTGGAAAPSAMMAGMDKMSVDMMAGSSAADVDVAFICSMIPHHRGAIDMARAELAQGDDPWARTLAEQVIAAQEKEIADMLAWLEKQGE